MSTAAKDRLRIAAIADLHYTRTSQGAYQPLFAQITDEADILLLCGDLTDYGLAEEARLLGKELTAGLKIPAVGVLGNHDHESEQADEVRSIMIDAGVVILDGDAHEVQGVGFAGVKGFAGGFDRGTLGPWGESAVKAFVREAVGEALKLETALARLRSTPRVALLHYSPVRSTVEGEPPEIFAFCGCSRLEEPLIRYPVSAVFHGHAHHGRLEGHTRSGVPVFNVSLPLLRQHSSDRPFRVIELSKETGEVLGFERRAGRDRRGAA